MKWILARLEWLTTPAGHFFMSGMNAMGTFLCILEGSPWFIFSLVMAVYIHYQAVRMNKANMISLIEAIRAEVKRGG